ncbi:hypothetical protein ACJZ2D_012878 [Fusarium nematophilum]
MPSHASVIPRCITTARNGMLRVTPTHETNTYPSTYLNPGSDSTALRPAPIFPTCHIPRSYICQGQGYQPSNRLATVQGSVVLSPKQVENQAVLRHSERCLGGL